MELSLRIPKALLIAAAALVLVGGVGGGAYYLGQNSDSGAGDDEAFEEGRTEGFSEGRDDGYDTGYDVGFDAGKPKETGKSVFGPTYNDGLREGKEIGFDSGYKNGGYNALSLGSFEWQTGSLYIVQVQEDPGPLRYQVETQLQMEAGEEYAARGTEIFSGPTD